MLGVIGLALSGVSLLDKFTGGGITKLFGGKTDEQQREERRARYVKAVQDSKMATLAKQNALFSEGVKQLRQTVAGATAGSAQRAAFRAKAMGKSSDVESFVLPGESAALETGSQALKGYQLAGQRELEQTAQYYDSLALQGEHEFANRPIDPGLTDYAGELGSMLTQYDQTQQIIGAMNPQGGTEGTPGEANPFLGSSTMDAKGMLKVPSLESRPYSPAELSGPLNRDMLLGSDRKTLLSAPLTADPNKPSLLNWGARPSWGSYNKRRKF
jgi:hypothetical protein